MLLRFTKMHGLGNDFMVVDGLTQSVRFSAEKVRQWADRRRGVGFDQLLLVEPPTDPDADFRYRIYNADGSEAGQCGNGARCFARFVYEKRLSCKKTISVQVQDRMMTMTLLEDGQVKVNMGEPVFCTKDIPFLQENPEIGERYRLTLENGLNVAVGVVSMGNPHAVVLFSELSCSDEFWQSQMIPGVGKQIQEHPDFPESCNAGFLQVISESEMNLRVQERGAGETLACGSGACAAMAIARTGNLVGDTAKIHVRGGTLTLEWKGPGNPLYMTGSATNVFEGQLRI